MADRAAALVGVALQDDVARLQIELILGEHLVHIGAKLPDDHPPFRVGDHRELIVLFADHRRHGRAEQHRVHFMAGIAQGVLDQVERNAVDPTALPRLCRCGTLIAAHAAVSAYGGRTSGWPFGARLQRSSGPAAEHVGADA